MFEWRLERRAPEEASARYVDTPARRGCPIATAPEGAGAAVPERSAHRPPRANRRLVEKRQSPKNHSCRSEGVAESKPKNHSCPVKKQQSPKNPLPNRSRESQGAVSPTPPRAPLSGKQISRPSNNSRPVKETPVSQGDTEVCTKRRTLRS